MWQSLCPGGSLVEDIPWESPQVLAKLRRRVDLVVLISEESEKRRQVTVFSRRFAIVMVWFVTILSGSVILTTSIPDEGYLRAFGWGGVMAGAVFLVGVYACDGSGSVKKMKALEGVVGRNNDSPKGE
jgi:hypothetical protein